MHVLFSREFNCEMVINMVILFIKPFDLINNVTSNNKFAIGLCKDDMWCPLAIKE